MISYKNDLYPKAHPSRKSWTFCVTVKTTRGTKDYSLDDNKINERGTWSYKREKKKKNIQKHKQKSKVFKLILHRNIP